MSDENTIFSGEVEIEDLARGWLREPGAPGADDPDGVLVCLHCGARFAEGRVHTMEEEQLLAEAAARRHVRAAHGGPFAALMASTAGSGSGLTDIQRLIVQAMHEGKSDRDIAAALGGKAASTVRNHRFNLRKREAEAKVFLALMSMLAGRGKPGADFIAFHPAMPAAVADDRVIVETDEAARIEGKYLAARPDGGLDLKSFPKKQKEKLVILRRLAGLFEPGKRYAEPEVNRILSPVWHDHVTLRRYLIEYRFLDRKPDGSAYWRT